MFFSIEYSLVLSRVSLLKGGSFCSFSFYTSLQRKLSTMRKSISLLFFLVTLIYGNPTIPTVTFIKPNANTMRRLNPLKLFFTVVHKPAQQPDYSIEWNLSFLRTMLLESTHVSDDDKTLFLMKFSNIENDYPEWTQEQHDQLERFTEKYFNLFKSPDLFLPFIDCPALTYAITDEWLNDLHPKIDEEKRSLVRAKAVQHLCESE
jgi:hypothetical protein